MSTHHTQPLRLWEILDHAVALYRHCFQMLMRVAALVLIPAQIICTAFIWAMIAWGRSQTQHSDRVTIIVIGLAIGFIGVFLAGLLVLGADVKIASEGYLERAPASAIPDPSKAHLCRSRLRTPGRVRGQRPRTAAR
jgi:hypothetical protein